MNSPHDTILTALVAGAITGWTMVDAIKEFGLMAGAMTSFTGLAMMILITRA